MSAGRGRGATLSDTLSETTAAAAAPAASVAAAAAAATGSRSRHRATGTVICRRGREMPLAGRRAPHRIPTAEYLPFVKNSLKLVVCVWSIKGCQETGDYFMAGCQILFS